MDYYHDDSYPIPEYLRQFKNIYCDIYGFIGLIYGQSIITASSNDHRTSEALAQIWSLKARYDSTNKGTEKTQ